MIKNQNWIDAYISCRIQSDDCGLLIWYKDNRKTKSFTLYSIDLTFLQYIKPSKPLTMTKFSCILALNYIYDGILSNILNVMALLLIH